MSPGMPGHRVRMRECLRTWAIPRNVERMATKTAGCARGCHWTCALRPRDSSSGHLPESSYTFPPAPRNPSRWAARRRSEGVPRRHMYNKRLRSMHGQDPIRTRDDDEKHTNMPLARVRRAVNVGGERLFDQLHIPVNDERIDRDPGRRPTYPIPFCLCSRAVRLFVLSFSK